VTDSCVCVCVRVRACVCVKTVSVCVTSRSTGVFTVYFEVKGSAWGRWMYVHIISRVCRHYSVLYFYGCIRPLVYTRSASSDSFHYLYLCPSSSHVWILIYVFDKFINTNIFFSKQCFEKFTQLQLQTKNQIFIQ